MKEIDEIDFKAEYKIKGNKFKLLSSEEESDANKEVIKLIFKREKEQPWD